MHQSASMRCPTCHCAVTAAGSLSVFAGTRGYPERSVSIDVLYVRRKDTVMMFWRNIIRAKTAGNVRNG
jgi:hypothetical protein